MKIKLFLINASLSLYLIGLFTTIGGSIQIGAVSVLVGAAMLIASCLLQLAQSYRQSKIWTWQMLGFGIALLALVTIFFHGFSFSLGMMMAFRVQVFTSLYLASGFTVPILFFFFSSKSAAAEDKRWIKIGVSVGAVLGLLGLLGYSRIIPFPTQAIFYSWVFVLLFYLIFLTKKYFATKDERDKRENLKLLLISFLFLGFWGFRFLISSPLQDGLIKAAVHFGFIPLFILPLSIITVRKNYPYIVFLFYFILLDFFFIQFDATFNYLVNVGLNDCEGYELATDFPTNTDPGLPLNELMQEVSHEELEEILLEWKEKDFSPKGIEVVYQAELPNGDSVKVISHLVNGKKHFGAIRIPDQLDITNAPILMVLEGGGTGLDITKLNRITQARCAEQSDQYISILPSYRGCILRGDGFCFRSEGYFGDPWLGPAEDATAFLEAVIKYCDKPDSTKVLAMGISRGATVALIMGGLTDKLDYLISTSTHTKFLDEYVVTNERVGASYARAFFTPADSPAQIRKRMIASSPYFFADKLPPFEVHQGTKDEQTTVWHAQVLQDRLNEIGRDSSSYKLFIYENQGHGYNDEQAVCQSLASFIDK
ncbi:MAG: prolyl oligopeptidase family serine peptidase [Bacteroidota bacterium]